MPGGLLSGRTVFLSASVPTKAREQAFPRVPDAAFEIEQAVISLARAVFAEGGRLVFGGHPSISPLVAMVAGEYRTPVLGAAPDRAPPPVLIYQSEAFRGHVPDETMLMFRLGAAELRWTEAMAGERFAPTPDRTEPPCPKSLEFMRRRMIEEATPSAMVAIGGMDGVVDEAGLFRALRSSSPLFALQCCGGAAAGLGAAHPSVLCIDQVVLKEIDALRRAQPERAPPSAPAAEAPVVPYPLIMQTLVGMIAGGRRG